MDKTVLKTIIFDQQKYLFEENHINRLTNDVNKDNEIVVISGVRRCGKSTLIHEIRSHLKNGNYYLNFDDERLIHFKVEDFQLLYELFIELFGEQQIFYFDEIQNIDGWERFIRRLYDLSIKVFVTGSNASMLSKELGTHLTGRYYQYELYPFSFTEFLAFKKVTLTEETIYSTQGKARIKSLFNEYFNYGGFPAYLQNKNKQYLKSLYESIIYRDVMVRHGLTNEKEILELLYYLASNVSRLASYNNLAKIIGVSNATTIKNYLEYLQNTYLLFVVNKFDFSVKKQIQNPKKIYFIDLALVRELGFYTSEDNGRLLENLVFLELKRNAKEVYYHKQKHECDFLIKEKNKIINAIQVCWSFSDPKTREREINGLMDAMDTYQLDKGLILTESEEEDFIKENHSIEVKPVWRWLIE